MVTERFPTTLRGAAVKCWEVNGRLSGRQLGLWLLQVLQGLEHARSRGVVHRDVKADNVFLTADGRAVVGDWGEGMLLYTGGTQATVKRTIEGLNLHDYATPSTGAAASGECVTDGPAARLDSALEDQMSGYQVQLFEGAGDEAVPKSVSQSMLQGGGAMSVRSPEHGTLMSGSVCLDAWGRPMVTAAQVYASSDAWAAGRMMWEILAQQAQVAGAVLVALPDNTTWYPDGAIPRLPAQAGCPDALEAVLRGLLQSRPEDRLPPEEAVRALHASLYGPQDIDTYAFDPDAAHGRGGASTIHPWIREQLLGCVAAHHAVPSMSIDRMVGQEAASQRQDAIQSSSLDADGYPDADQDASHAGGGLAAEQVTEDPSLASGSSGSSAKPAIAGAALQADKQIEDALIASL